MDSTKKIDSSLAGVRVLELGQLIAAPFAGMLLGSFGAEVIKVEPPGQGDPMRSWRRMHKDTSLWWYSIARNKKSITLDLRKPEGQQLLRRLVAELRVDILIENFRPGRMEAWGIGYEALSALNPGLIMVRVTGWGQDGPYAERPGFASVAEAIGGLRFLTGEPDRPPVRTGISLGDSLAGLHAAYGALAALRARDHNGGVGQIVDTAIYETVFNFMESMLPEYDYDGFVRERSGARLPGIVPSNTYPCADGKFIIIGGNNDSIFKRLMIAIERPDLAEDKRLADNRGRVQHEQMIEDALHGWISARSYAEVFERLDAAAVPVGPIYSIADIAQDPQYLARNVFEQVELADGTAFRIPVVAPRLSKTPSKTNWIGPELGAHNRTIYCDALGLSDAELTELVQRTVV